MLLFEEKAFHASEILNGVVDFLKLLLGRPHQVYLDFSCMLDHFVEILHIVAFALGSAQLADAFIARITELGV